MLGLRPTILISLVLALIVITATAGSNKPKPTCRDCTAKFDKCIKTCKPGHFWACNRDCDCKIAKDYAFCHNSCDMGGPESACEIF